MYLQDIAAQLGVSLWLLITIFVWSFVWKFLALWKSARKGHIGWFVVFALVNTIGILEILYIYVFSEKNKKENQTNKKGKVTGKKKKR